MKKRKNIAKIGLDVAKIVLMGCIVCWLPLRSHAQGNPQSKHQAMMHYLEAVGQYQQQQYDTAFRAATASLNLDSTRAGTWELRGLCSMNLGDPASAEKDLFHATQLDPENARTWMLKGEALTRLGSYPAALIDLNHALSLQPNDPGFLFYRAKAQTLAGNYAEALHDFEAIGPFDNQTPEVQKYWGLAVWRSQGPEKGCPMLHTAAEGGALGLEEILQSDCRAEK